MCKEDVKLARAAYPGQSKTVTTPNTNRLILGSNGERYSLSAYIGTTTPLTKNISAMIAAKVGGAYYPLIGLTAEHNVGYVSLIDVGSIIMEEIWFVFDGADPPDNLIVGETVWVKTQEQI